MSNIKDLVEELGISVTCRKQNKVNESFKDYNSWRIGVTFNNKSYFFDYWTGPLLGTKSDRFAYDALLSLCEQAQMNSSFEEWCVEFGGNDNQKNISDFDYFTGVKSKMISLLGADIINEIVVESYCE